jgi:hypothetical protein
MLVKKSPKGILLIICVFHVLSSATAGIAFSDIILISKIKMAEAYGQHFLVSWAFFVREFWDVL